MKVESISRNHCFFFKKKEIKKFLKIKYSEKATLRPLETTNSIDPKKKKGNHVGLYYLSQKLGHFSFSTFILFSSSSSCILLQSKFVSFTSIMYVRNFAVKLRMYQKKKGHQNP
jgi:hypothetical protein